ncbi:hypothetical protein [[Haemophilus] ducreyi]|uniref:Uncharacterized protein n=1 Tax=Haemophilus ducreyi (strain 35000HP / ATCC 700724) TaxID=233412 RepID=Q7VMM6_HAEDU|nr:hypothetical protein [[Haemophilus] ducreyi]AAP95830.1 hypothetical protein HD_0948 [[Haemophilus] ducreyi 35000HP]
MTREEKLEELYKAALALEDAFLKHVNYSKSSLSAEDFFTLNEFYCALNNLKETK